MSAVFLCERVEAHVKTKVLRTDLTATVRERERVIIVVASRSERVCSSSCENDESSRMSLPVWG